MFRFYFILFLIFYYAVFHRFHRSIFVRTPFRATSPLNCFIIYWYRFSLHIFYVLKIVIIPMLAVSVIFPLTWITAGRGGSKNAPVYGTYRLIDNACLIFLLFLISTALVMFPATQLRIRTRILNTEFSVANCRNGSKNEKTKHDKKTGKSNGKLHGNILCDCEIGLHKHKLDWMISWGLLFGKQVEGNRHCHVTKSRYLG